MLTTVVRELVGSGLRPILIGGQAAVCHGLGGTTSDWDFVVAKTPEAKELIRGVLARWGFAYRCVTPGVPVPAVAGGMAERQNLRFTSPFGELDFVHGLDFAADALVGSGPGDHLWYDALLGHAGMRTHHGIDLLVLDDAAVVLSKLVRGTDADRAVRQAYLARRGG